MTRAGILLLAVLSLMGLGVAVAQTAAAQGPSTLSQDDQRAEAIRELQVVRASIDHTLTLMKDGDAPAALAEARSGYLNHFEKVEVPLRLTDPALTSETETKFAEIRGLVSSDAPVDETRSQIIELRALIDQAERQLTEQTAVAPAVIGAQSFVIIFREGLEAVLLIAVLVGYLESVKATQYRKPILWGMALAVVATALTFVLLRSVLAAIPLGREILEAITALAAVAVLFYVSFWLVSRLDQKRWLEFARARVWTAISIGSVSALVLVGFTALYREGFETALLYQSLLSFGEGMAVWVLVGFLTGVAVLAVVAWLVLRLGQKLPIKAFLMVAIVMLMATSVTMLGNAIRALQEADVVALTPIDALPHAPIFVSQSLGYWPSVQTITAQLLLILIYVVGAIYIFVVRPRREAAAWHPSASGQPVPVS